MYCFHYYVQYHSGAFFLLLLSSLWLLLLLFSSSPLHHPFHYSMCPGNPNDLFNMLHYSLISPTEAAKTEQSFFRVVLEGRNHDHYLTAVSDNEKQLAAEHDFSIYVLSFRFGSLRVEWVRSARSESWLSLLLDLRRQREAYVCIYKGFNSIQSGIYRGFKRKTEKNKADNEVQSTRIEWEDTHN